MSIEQQLMDRSGGNRELCGADQGHQPDQQPGAYRRQGKRVQIVLVAKFLNKA
ncbi:hypothetical protein [Zobellella maritima]|uniref:hypothetical protein n=1 Tax=Zobellella maritima TaxID=2059725 RepID=UPI0013004C26|nr:hypothetical protein [Zobellella maritima]